MNLHVQASTAPVPDLRYASMLGSVYSVRKVEAQL
jgi:hypothetical protein